ncbi:MAG: hypothetical protein KF754_11925 [Planctomycetes bacterium]|nr:hypothetical protein [Planctomycetota bacterium]
MSRLRMVAVIALGVLSLSQMAFGLARAEDARRAAAATAAAPYPKVFCAKDGYEAYAMNFTLIATDSRGEQTTVTLTPEVYKRIEGPYNRRNVYGAVLAFAPLLEPALRDEVVDYAFRRDGGLRRELGLPDDLRKLVIRIEPKPGVAAESHEYTYQWDTNP